MPCSVLNVSTVLGEYLQLVCPTFIHQLTRLRGVLSTLVEPVSRDFRHNAIACGKIIISALSPNARCSLGPPTLRLPLRITIDGPGMCLI